MSAQTLEVGLEQSGKSGYKPGCWRWSLKAGKCTWCTLLALVKGLLLVCSSVLPENSEARASRPSQAAAVPMTRSVTLALAPTVIALRQSRVAVSISVMMSTRRVAVAADASVFSTVMVICMGSPGLQYCLSSETLSIVRLKMLKRQMFGCARLDLLSRRFLLAPRERQAQAVGLGTSSQVEAAAA